MKVVFRVDASARMGTGHLMRCMALAEALQERGAQTLFVCREHEGNLIATLRRKAVPVTVLPAPTAPVGHEGEDYAAWLGVSQAEDAEHTIEALQGDKPDWLVVDHYGLDVEWEQCLRPHVGKLLVIDDVANRHHDCDVLLNQNYSAEGERRYTGLVPDTCKVLLGPRYALLRREFRVIRERFSPRSGDLRKILVFFTAGDDQGETLKAMQGIELYGKVERVDVVVGQSNPSNAEIAKKCNSLRWGYHCQIDYMATLIAQADIVIGAGGSSNWERCALGIPAVVTILAEIQAPIAQALDRAGVVRNLGWGRDLQAADYANVLATLNRDRLSAMSAQALQLVDAEGAERMADVLLAAQPRVSEQSKRISC
jgi:UDP-2,4-diacetamido-2,4,6-trideoxy-beta-L-altropyranose hydrolase